MSVVATNGASCTTAGLRCESTSHHSRADVNTSIATTAMKNSATAAFNLSLKMSRAASAFDDPASRAACERKPSFVSAEKTFWYPDVIVTIMSQTNGPSVTQ